MLPGVPEILWENLQGKAIWRPSGLGGTYLLPAQNGRQRDHGRGTLSRLAACLGSQLACGPALVKSPCPSRSRSPCSLLHGGQKQPWTQGSRERGMRRPGVGVDGVSLHRIRTEESDVKSHTQRGCRAQRFGVWAQTPAVWAQTPALPSAGHVALDTLLTSPSLSAFAGEIGTTAD